MIAWAAAVVTLGLIAGPTIAGVAARADDAPPEAARLIEAPSRLPDLIGRFPGRVRHGDGVVELLDAGGSAAPARPWLGIVERRGPALWLRTQVGTWRLRGTLARPRLAGPGYLVWVVGAMRGDELTIVRLGVLARPGEFTDWARR